MHGGSLLVTALTRRDQPALALAPLDPVTTVRLAACPDDPLDLSLAQDHFTIGADPTCDLVIPRARSTAVSPVHATLDRIGAALLVRDRDSPNGTFRNRACPRCPTLHVHPGDTFWIADVPLLVTDPHLEALRCHLACHLGLTRDAAINDAVTTIAADHPLLLLGPPGTGALQLAAVIHATSPRRHNAFLASTPPPLALLDHAQGATVFLDLDTVTRLSARTVATLFDPARGLRLIVAAATDRLALSRLAHHRPALHAIPLAPLAARATDVPALLAYHWLTALDTPPPLPLLSPAARRALIAYPWPRNLAELHEHSPRILAYLQTSSLRRAAARLSIRHQTLSQHLARLSFPLADRDPFPHFTQPRLDARRRLR